MREKKVVGLFFLCDYAMVDDVVIINQDRFHRFDLMSAIDNNFI
jgi:hypothetical protein